MKILLINPNTSPHVTERMLAQARQVVGPGVVVEGVTARFGPALIGSRSEHAIAQHAALELAARHHAGADAVILGVSMDTALWPVRELLDIPVVGMAEAALLTGCQLGGRIGCLTLGPRLLPLYEEMTAAYGLASRIARWRALDLPAAYGPALDDGVARAVEQACRNLVDDDGAEVVVLCAAVLTGYARRVGDTVGVPVIDAIDAACQQALALARLGSIGARAGSFARPRGRRSEGLDGALAAQLADPGH